MVTDQAKLKADTIQEIAQKMLFIDTLETQDRDSLDFHGVAVWQVAAALAAACEAGKKSSKRK